MLVQSIARPGVSLPAADRTRVGGGLRAVIYLWLPVDTRAVPASVRNRIMVTAGTGDSTRVHTLDVPEVAVTASAAVIGPPLSCGPWLGSEGVPYGFDWVELLGACQTFTACTRKTAERRVTQIPLDRALVRFP